MMQVKDAVEEYRYAILQLSDQTQNWYLQKLERFSNWCTRQGVELDKLKPYTIAKFLHEMEAAMHPIAGTVLSSYTVHGYARTIRTFLFWCAADPQNYCSRSVPANMVMPKIKQTVIEIFTSLQIKALFAATEGGYTPALQARDKAILAVLLDTGIRAGELISLTLENVHITPQEGWIRVCGKGDKEREIGMGKQARQLLNSYIKRYRPQVKDESVVFLAHKRMPLTINGLDQMLYRLAERAHIEDCHAHKFRHTFACNYLLQGGDIFVLSRLMGHSSVQVTEIYLRAIKAEQARKTSKSVLDNLK